MRRNDLRLSLTGLRWLGKSTELLTRVNRWNSDVQGGIVDGGLTHIVWHDSLRDVLNWWQCLLTLVADRIEGTCGDCQGELLDRVRQAYRLNDDIVFRSPQAPRSRRSAWGRRKSTQTTLKKSGP